MKRILLLATGGTIASVEGASGLTPGLDAAELAAAVPGIRDYCAVDTEQVMSLDSTNVRPEHWLLLARAIARSYDRYDGFVITHGTDTMAYTAAALTYLIQNSQKPIVLTGAQRPIGSEASDGPKNLLDSFYFCACSGAAGVYVVFGGKAILGARARKVRTMSYSAFDSINYPVAAQIHHRQITSYLLAPEPEGGPVRFYQKLDPAVCLVKLVPGMRPDILARLGEDHRAVIIESFGTGGLPFAEDRDFLQVAEDLAARGRALVLATQVTFEGSDLDVYEVGRRVADIEGVLQTYDMTLEAAVAKLMWLLPMAKDNREVRRLFYSPVSRDIYRPGV